MHGLLALLFVEMFGAAMTIPVFQYFCMVQLRLSATYVGVIMSCFNAAQLFGAPIVGRLSDALGRRAALLGCFLWTSVCFMATAGVNTFGEMLFVRTCAGLSGGSIPITQAMVMDVAAPQERPAVLGVMGGLLGLAFTLGPTAVTLALFLADFSRRWVFVAAAVFALMGCLVGFCVLQETLPPSKRRPLGGGPPQQGDAKDHADGFLQEIWAVSSAPMACIWVGRFCSSFAFLCLFSTYAFLIRDAFHWGDSEFGLVLAMSGICGALAQFFLYPPTSAVLGKHAVFAVGSVCVALYFVCLPYVTLTHRDVSMHILVKVLFCVGCAFMDAGVPDLVGFHAPEDRMGFAQGLTTAFRSLASVLAPLVAGRAYDESPYVVYVTAACVVSVGGVAVALAPLLSKHRQPWDAETGELQKLLKQ